jgi:hypothetical protein
MTISNFTSQLDYLQVASRASLQSFELTRLNHAANLRQEIAALIGQWIQETSERFAKKGERPREGNAGERCMGQGARRAGFGAPTRRHGARHAQCGARRRTSKCSMRESG